MFDLHPLAFWCRLLLFIPVISEEHLVASMYLEPRFWLFLTETVSYLFLVKIILQVLFQLVPSRPVIINNEFL